MGTLNEGAVISGSDVAAAARAWLGVPFRHQGRSREGVDCAGLIICIARELGLVDAGFDVQGYSRRPDGVSLLAACGMHCERILPAGMAPGDVALLRIDQHPQHLAVLAEYFAGGRSLVHAYAPARAVAETRLDEWWQQRLVAVFRLPGVEAA